VTDVVLVTGAAGFIGVPTTRALLARGATVVALDNFAVGSRERLAGLGGLLTVEEIDLRESSRLRRVVASTQPMAVVHLAAHHFIPFCIAHPAETIEVNVLGTQCLLDALVDASPRRLVFASTADVYAPSLQPHAEDDEIGPPNVYGVSKAAAEWLCQFHMGEDILWIARLFNVYGRGETNPHVLPHILDSIANSNTIPLGNVSPRRDYVFVDDVADVLAWAALEAPEPAVVNIGSGRSWSVEELVDQLRALTGRPLKIEVDQERIRTNDRPNLQSVNGRLLDAVPELQLTDLESGLRRTVDTVTAPP